MKIFISWSGEISKELGETLRDWIPSVLQTVRPYFTPNDIEKGARWNSEITQELDATNIGIICLTRENLEKPWVMFEAGALSKSVESSKLCPILFGLDSSDLSGPLAQFQASQFSKAEIRSLMSTINESCGDQKLLEDVFAKVFEKWWPDLEEKVGSILKKAVNPDDQKTVRDEREILDEILGLVRILSRKTDRFQPIDIESFPDVEMFELNQLISRIADLFVSLRLGIGTEKPWPYMEDILDQMENVLIHLVGRLNSPEATKALRRRIISARFVRRRESRASDDEEDFKC